MRLIVVALGVASFNHRANGRCRLRGQASEPERLLAIHDGPCQSFRYSITSGSPGARGVHGLEKLLSKDK